MLDIIALLESQQHVADHARAALPASPERPDDRDDRLRHRLSVALHHLAERLDPQPAGYPSTSTTAAGCQ